MVVNCAIGEMLFGSFVPTAKGLNNLNIARYPVKAKKII